MGIQPEKEREGEGEREKERESRHGGSQISKKLVWETGPSFIVQESFLYFLLHIEING